MIFAELNGCPLQATISLTQSCFLTQGPTSPPSFFHLLLHFPSMQLTNRSMIYGRLTVLEPAASHNFAFAFCFQVELLSALENNQWEALQVAVRLLSLLYGSITASQTLVGIQCPTQGHFGRKDARFIKGMSFFFSLHPCSFIVNVGCQYMCSKLPSNMKV